MKQNFSEPLENWLHRSTQLVSYLEDNFSYLLNTSYDSSLSCSVIREEFEILKKFVININ